MPGPLPMQTPGNLNWDPASVEMPEIPMLPPGEDAMSMTIAGVLPTLTTPMAASVAALQAKETTFSGKLGSAESAYDDADIQGGQSVGRYGQMLGQLGQMAGQAGAPAQQLGQQAGQFGSMMQQAMQGAQGSGSPPQAQKDAAGDAEQPADRRDRDHREREARDGRAPLDSAASGAAPDGADRAPIAPPHRAGVENLERGM